MYVFDEEGETESSAFFNKLLGIEKNNNGNCTTTQKDMSFEVGKFQCKVEILKPTKPAHQHDWSKFKKHMQEEHAMSIIVYHPESATSWNTVE